MLIQKYNNMIKEKYGYYDEELVKKLVKLGDDNVLRLYSKERDRVNKAELINEEQLKRYGYGVTFLDSNVRMYRLPADEFFKIMCNYQDYSISTVYCTKTCSLKDTYVIDLLKKIASAPGVYFNIKDIHKTEFSISTRISIILYRRKDDTYKHAILISLIIPCKETPNMLSLIIRDIKINLFIRKIKKILKKSMGKSGAKY